MLKRLPTGLLNGLRLDGPSSINEDREQSGECLLGDLNN